MTRPRSIMIDMETKGTGVNSFILSIGAVAFDDDGFLNEYEKTEPVAFYGQVPWDDPSQVERETDQATLEWWSQQGEPMKILQSPNAEQAEWVYPGIEELLTAFAEFVKLHKNDAGRLISKGTDFDIAILRSAMRAFNVGLPWKYNHTRCMRGWMDACTSAGISKHLHMGFHGGNPGIKHHAADDAIWQTMIYVRYNHELWKVMHKNAQIGLDLTSMSVANPAPHAASPMGIGAAAGGTTLVFSDGLSMRPAPTLKDAP